LGFSIYSKIKIATESTKLAMPEVKIGILTNSSGGYFLSRLRKGIGMYLGLTGSMVVGEDVVKIGLADYFVPRVKLGELESELKRVINEENKTDLVSLKAVVEKYYSLKINEKYELEDFTERHFEKDTVFEVMDSLQKAIDVENCSIAKSVLNEIKENCPKSVRVIFELIKRAKSMELKDELVMEGLADIKMQGESDFIEGVKSRLVDRSNKPKWTHKSVYDMSEKELESYFIVDEECVRKFESVLRGTV